DGPLVVLTSRFSASASEIFAAALQDYGRAVIVGDKATFGKGTVQTFIELGNWLPFFGRRDSEEGALRLTIQKFYRISGGSTQFKGVVSDIILPSPVDHEEVGESALRFPLPYDEVDPLPHVKVADLGPVIQQLRELSASRVAQHTEFRDMQEDLRRLRERMEANVLSLDETARRAEREADKARLKARREARAERRKNEFPSYLITVDNAKNPELESMQSVIEQRRAEANRHREPGAQESSESAEAESDEEDELRMSPMDRPEIDPIRDETLAILLDLIRLNAQTGPVTAR
ncbi:MAG: carboxy terminal-processing peptidase, partial [Verrucomicrobiia bacterium]